jgi:hypothetical protein
MTNPGTYAAKVISHAISETKAGDPQAAVTFSFNDGGPKTMTWFGSFKEGKARDITIKALLACGLKGNNPAGPLEIGKEVSIVIEDEEGQDGKTRSKIRWVNALGAVRNVIPQDMAKAKLSDLEGAVMAARQGANGGGNSDFGSFGSGSFDDEIPF